jgi:hypothetical protein
MILGTTTNKVSEKKNKSEIDMCGIKREALDLSFFRPQTIPTKENSI